MSVVTLWPAAPSQGGTILPPLAAAWSVLRTRLVGMAKPMPTEPPDCEKIAVLMPTRRPSRSTSAPPELPGLMAASVWMKERKSLMPMVRAKPETMPLVTVWPTPKGLPMASTRSPTSSWSLSPISSTGRRSPCVSSLSTAKSARSSASTRRASNSRRSASTTVISCASLMTWRLVTMRPAASRMTPRLVAEEAAEEGIVEERGRAAAAPDDAAREDIDHRRRRLLHHRREGKPDDLAARRRSARLRRCG